jgi:hypothetical protein
MSRSYKKYPIVRQERVDGRCSNRFIRHNIDYEIPPHGSFHKKIRANGINWAYYWSLEDAKQFYKANPSLHERFTLEEYLIWYKKDVLSK